MLVTTTSSIKNSQPVVGNNCLLQACCWSRLTTDLLRRSNTTNNKGLLWQSMLCHPAELIALVAKIFSGFFCCWVHRFMSYIVHWIIFKSFSWDIWRRVLLWVEGAEWAWNGVATRKFCEAELRKGILIEMQNFLCTRAKYLRVICHCKLFSYKLWMQSNYTSFAFNYDAYNWKKLCWLSRWVVVKLLRIKLT